MRRVILAWAVCAAGCGGKHDCDAWRQWGSDPAHQGAVCVSGQPVANALAQVFFDPFIEQEKTDAGNEILVHYQGPLVEDDDVYLMVKAGTYTSCDRTTTICPLFYRNTQVWVEKGFRWEKGALVEKWRFESDWKPEPSGGFEPMFQPALSGDYIYVPGAGGSVYKLRRKTGEMVAHIQPLGATINPDAYVAGALSVDRDGNIYFATLELDHNNPYGVDATGRLVKIAPDDSFTTKTYQELAQGAPAATDMCRGVFGRETARPWPPPDDENGNPVYPSDIPCGSQRPGINAAPAIGDDGTVFLVSRAHFNSRYAYVIALNPDLTVKWATSLNRILADGCGVIVPADGTDSTHVFDCRMGARMGVDPSTNDLPAARVVDDSSSSPVALPDGGVAYGAYTAYNGSRGHLVQIDKDGRVQGDYIFGWDTTPAVYRHGGSYSLIVKENYYGQDENGVNLGPFFITQLDSSLRVQWQFKSTNTKSCVRHEDGTIDCQEDHPNGFEWCINAPAVDKNGVVYANSEDGNLYAIGQGGIEKGHLFMEMAIGAAYTPLALDNQGRIYTLNDGKLTVIGK